jgi:hypothetical protein
VAGCETGGDRSFRRVFKLGRLTTINATHISAVHQTSEINGIYLVTIKGYRGLRSLCVPPDATSRLRFSQVNREMLMIMVIKPREKTPMRPFFCRDGSFRYGRMKKGKMNTKVINYQFYASQQLVLNSFVVHT